MIALDRIRALRPTPEMIAAALRHHTGLCLAVVGEQLCAAPAEHDGEHDLVDQQRFVFKSDGRTIRAEVRR